MPSRAPPSAAGRRRCPGHHLGPGPVGKDVLGGGPGEVRTGCFGPRRSPARRGSKPGLPSGHRDRWSGSALPRRSPGTLASPPPGLDMPARLRAIASAARGAHALHEHGQLHEAICPQSVALVPIGSPGQATAPEPRGTPDDGTASAVLSPPALANGQAPLAQVGYPPLGYIDPQLLRGEGGRWSDIWALGATVHQAVTGSVPFPGLDELPVVQALSRLLSVPCPGSRRDCLMLYRRWSPSASRSTRRTAPLPRARSPSAWTRQPQSGDAGHVDR